MEYAEDYDLWMRMLASGKKFVNLDKVFTYYRLHEQQVTTCHHEEQAQKTQIIRAWALKKQIELEKKAFQEPAFIPDTTNQCTINYCGPTTPTTPTTPTIGPSASPTPTVTTMCIGF